MSGSKRVTVPLKRLDREVHGFFSTDFRWPVGTEEVARMNAQRVGDRLDCRKRQVAGLRLQDRDVPVGHLTALREIHLAEAHLFAETANIFPNNILKISTTCH